MDNDIIVSGINTNAGKKYATAWQANRYMEQGFSVATMKFIQTGNNGFSEDILAHRRIMGISPLPEDRDLTTSPVIFTYPASAQLAARIDGRDIDVASIDRSVETLSGRYDIVLVEGAGGLMVPIADDFFTVDYVASRNLPIIIVTNGILGSINHTVLSLEAIRSRGISLHSVIYNTYFDKDEIIAEDTRGFIDRYLQREFPASVMMVMPSVS